MGAIFFSRLPQTKDVSSRGQDYSMGSRRVPVRKEPTMMGSMPGKPGDLGPIKMFTTISSSMLCVEKMQEHSDDRLIFVPMRRIKSPTKLREGVI